jgi:hypothetical protein
LTDTAGGSSFYGDGGPDSITMGLGGNTVYFGTTYYGIQHGQSITDIVSGNEVAQIGFWGNTTAPAAITASTSADMTNITGFTVGGASHDVLDFNVQAWAGGGTGVAKLVQADGASIATPNNAVVGLEVGPGGVVAFGVDLVLYNVSGLTDASDLAAALTGPGAISMGLLNTLHHNEHVLFAYQVADASAAIGTDVIIADVDFLNGVPGLGGSTFGRSIVASDMVDIHNASLIGLGINAHDVHFSGLTG